MTVLQNVMMPMDFCDVHKRGERRDKALALLERFDVANQAEKTPDLLSPITAGETCGLELRRAPP